ncbi:Receptor-like serine/threonine-protein kinase [Quillaja saponaria]|uniref:non-specific serine/threonine protein kinase n=1 Tax=Quillaja saponaria TaxID=32244 RepID=A0AAD7LQ03_QUISA|nr:Receptor-like serine/threonine-protein kinase [Quillaja saponaria]
MQSRLLPPPPEAAAAVSVVTAPHVPGHHLHHLQEAILAGILSLTLLLLIFVTIFIYRKLSYNRTAPFDQYNHNQHRRFSYSLLRRATNSFSVSTRLGHGGFGSVHKATLPSGQSVALKLMNSPGSLQGEREFHNELSLSSQLNSPYILALLGFSSDRRGRKLILVYELMPNRSLQDALLDKKCVELMEWKKRFEIAVQIAKGIEYLHHYCNPPVIHGDIKPSNVLLDSDFSAKIGDFGLARLKTEDLEMVEENGGEGENVRKQKDGVVEIGDDNGSILEETESVMTGFEESSGLVDRSPESCVVRILDSEASPETVVMSPEVGVDKASMSEGCFDKLSIDSRKDLIGNGRKKGGSGRDWWWKQDSGGGSESGRVKDYVMEWIGSEIKKERPKSGWIASPSSADANGSAPKMEPKKQRKTLEWWASLDEDKLRKKDKNRKPREWWKEEFCEELTKKKKKKRALDSNGCSDSWWQKDDDMVHERKKKRKSKSSRGSIDWWLDSFSGELRNGRRNSQDWASGDIPKSGGISSTPSMRGTVCYIAPEYGGGGQLSERCDVYSFGVLLLVLVSGRRPLQVTASPMSEFERANLISWARQLAHNGKLLDLVDPYINSLDKEQALLCITIALLCLQRSPAKRPTMKEIAGMLSGEAEPPHLPFEFSPSPPSNFLFKSLKKVRNLRSVKVKLW